MGILMATQSRLEDVIEEWLERKHVSLWANWIITDKLSREAAAKWFAREVRDLNDYIGEEKNVRE
jgi:hypothetical protein